MEGAVAGAVAQCLLAGTSEAKAPGVGLQRLGGDSLPENRSARDRGGPVEKNLGSLSCSPEAKRRVVAAETGKLSLKRQCEVVGLPRSSFYHHSKSESRLNLDWMRLINEIYSDCTFYGSWQMRKALRDRGYCVGRKRVRRFMLEMGL